MFSLEHIFIKLLLMSQKLLLKPSAKFRIFLLFPLHLVFYICFCGKGLYISKLQPHYEFDDLIKNSLLKNKKLILIA